ncbi:MAG: hypothetical protein Q9181_007019, partial [Wetmoreana brouardii]
MLSPEGKKSKRKRNKKKRGKVLGGQQTTPPSVAIASLFYNGQYPEGEIVEHVTNNDNLQRTTT